MTPNEKNPPLDFAAMRERLASTQGKQYWRSLEELSGSEEFTKFLEREFPDQVIEWKESGTNRREFLRLMAASLAFAGVTGCKPSREEKIVPYVRMPEQIIPGKPLYYATAMPMEGVGTGLLVESHMGRPTKIEGNPDHPASLGASDRFAQASILDLYDPDRSQTVSNAGQVSSWQGFLATMKPALEAQKLVQGKGLRILTGAITSPSLIAQMQKLLAQYPNAKWYTHEAVGRANARAGAMLAFGRDVNIVHRFDRADVILAIDSDFLATGPGHLRAHRDFSERRNRKSPDGRQAEMNRLYVVEPTPTPTGMAADHRLPLRPDRFEAFTRAMAHRLGVHVASPASTSETLPEMWLNALDDDLRNYRIAGNPGPGLIVAGESQSPVVHALVHAMNAALGNVGKAVIYTDPLAPEIQGQSESLADLVSEMNSGQVEALVIMGCNPVFTAPADLEFAQAMEKVALRVHLGLYDDETAALCHWHVNQAHYLESWGDVRAFDGTVSIVQPLIEPLYGGKTPQQFIAGMIGQPLAASMDLVRDFWEKQHGNAATFNSFWQTALHDGLIRDSGLPAIEVVLQDQFLASLNSTVTPANEGVLNLVFRPDPCIGDGRFANNGWLQELPKPLTKITWDNAAMIAPATAQRLGLSDEQVVEIRNAGRSVYAPVAVVPGHAPDAVTVHFGYARTRAGRVGNGVGFNAYAIRTVAKPWSVSGVELRPTGDKYKLARTQHHHLMEGRHLVNSGTAAEFNEHPEHPPFVHEHEGHKPSLYSEDQYKGHAWGMSINLSSCIGCNACVVACQAENNIPVVGKDEVMRGREMHWLRIDHYYEGPMENPQSFHQPLLCMHCEKAPCEPVCPVAATTHSSEGLNDMVYNRCVGTRYCSNNCPYKVRRFNFFQYSDYETPSLALGRNPDVTVRSRGVMEKCTYCVQRINAARIDAEKEGRRVRDGEVVTACQQACPGRAIIFGDLNDPKSEVVRLKAQALDYELLGELNTQPRTTYLAALRNPNPALVSEQEPQS